MCACVLALHISALDPAALQNKSSLRPRVKVKLHPNQVSIVLKEQPTKTTNVVSQFDIMVIGCLVSLSLR